MFYYQFRCGILHKAEITKNSKVWKVGPLVRRTSDGTGLIINREKFHAELSNVLTAYLAEIRAGANSLLRMNFAKKMNFICRL